jgi:ABC-type Fe3+ transport system substrate-binding protein
MMERIASGDSLIGYNLLGSYAIVRAKTDPSIGYVLPRDYTLVMSRIIFITKASRNPNAAKLWVDFLLSKRGQEIIAGESRSSRCAATSRARHRRRPREHARRQHQAHRRGPGPPHLPGPGQAGSNSCASGARRAPAS